MNQRLGRALTCLVPLVFVLVACSGSPVELLDPKNSGRDAAEDAGSKKDGGSASTGDAGEDLPSPPIEGLLALRVEPAELAIVDNGVAPAESGTLKAIGTFESGERDVTDKVGWSIADVRLGSVQHGIVTSTSVGGTTRVAARAQGMTARADISFSLDIVLFAEGTPPVVEKLFPDDLTSDVVGDVAALRVVYPSHETMFPRNLGRVDHQWRVGAALNAFELRFESELAKVRVYTHRTSHTTDPALWGWLSNTHAGKSLSFTVRARSSDTPALVHRSNAITLYYSDSEVRGALYYWSTGAQGVMRAAIGSGSASKFFPARGSGDTTCAACHTVSRDGRRLAIGYGGENLRQVSIPDAKLEIPKAVGELGPSYGWGTYNPGATRLLYASKGKLSLLDADTGRAIRDVPLPKDMVATFPDWSPDGKWVVLSIGTGRMGNQNATGTSLARMPVRANDDFGPPQIILQSSAPDDTLCFPMFAPDSRTLAFVRAKGKSKDNPAAEIFLLPVDGSGAPQPLTRLNRSVGDATSAINIGNSMPTWAPSTDSRTYWLAFSSIRDYGTALAGQARDQIWGAALEVGDIGGTSDPSFAAFWMPFQQLEEHNHRAFWVLDPKQTCTPGIEVCDGIDNDCDGAPDNDCCTPEPEICGNSKDDDCDGTVDDGCNCQATEICDNNIDDDCDSLRDKNDEDCGPLL